MRLLGKTTPNYYARTAHRWPVHFDPFLDELLFGTNEIVRSSQNSNQATEKAPQRVSARVDVSEDRENYFVEAELPGFDKSDIDISCEDRCLTISARYENSTVSGAEQAPETAEKENPDGNAPDSGQSPRTQLLQERRWGEVQRSLRFSTDIDDSGVTASYENGVLSLQIPKLQRKKHRVCIN